MTEDLLSDEVMRCFGFDPTTGEPVREFGWHDPSAARDDADLRDGCELLELALGVDVCTKLAAADDGEAAASLHSLEAEVDRMFGLDEPSVSVPRGEVERLLADANSYREEIQRTLAEQRQREAAEREQAEREAEKYYDQVDAMWGLS